MASPYLTLSAAGGYLVDFENYERWWVAAGVEPFRSTATVIRKGLRVKLDEGEASLKRMTALSRLPLEEPEDTTRDVLAELQTLGMARRLT